MNLESPRSQVSHQSSGIAGGEICSDRISDLTAGNISSTDVGQCHGFGLSAQSRAEQSPSLYIVSANRFSS